MRPAWRLATSNLSARRSRTLLLIATVLLSSGLIAAVSCAMASVHKGIRARVEATVGASDLRVERYGKEDFDDSVVRQVEQWPEVSLVVGRLSAPIALKNPRSGKEASTIGNGVVLEKELRLRPQKLVAGRHAEGPGEVVLDEQAAATLEASVGDPLDVQRWGDPLSLKVVGIVTRPALGLGVVVRPESFVTLEQMRAIAEKPGKIREIDVVLKDPRRAEAIALQRADEMPPGTILKASSKITTGLNKNLESSQIGMAIASMLAYLAASFIIMTGLTTNVTERQRELAMLRCIGGSRWQMAESQLAVGLIIGLIGAAAGVPLGVLGALALVKIFPAQLPGGFAVNGPGMVMAIAGSLAAGVLGAAWPAWRAARTTPLEALAVRAKAARRSGLIACGLVGVALALLHVAVLTLIKDPTAVFWSDVAIGLPSLFTGYFLLAVPALVAVTLVCGPLLARVLGLPGERGGLLTRSVLATPYRFGFTAGAMMMGLALLVAIWTNGQAIMRDWLGTLKFPDAFVAGIRLTEKTQDRIEKLPFVTGTVAITLMNFKTDAFGISTFDHTRTTFIAFEPRPFFELTDLTWVQGDPKAAQAALERGGSVLVAREFNVTRGIGVGDTITLSHEGVPHEFKVVGVVASPGLDIVSKWFQIGEDYTEQAVNAVFGSRDDLKRLFGNDSINLIQIGLKPDADDAKAIAEIRKLAGFEVVEAGSGRQILGEIKGFLEGSLYIFSLVAVGSMLVACFGVANLIIAGIQSRQYEFGVLRAIGAQKGLLARLVLGEAILIALTACLLGTVMGVQASWAGQRMYEIMLGLLLKVRIPLGPTAAGWATVTIITLGAALPAVLSLNRRRPRELLGAVRG